MGQNCLLADQVYSLFSCGITRFFFCFLFFYLAFFNRDYLFWSLIVTALSSLYKERKIRSWSSEWQ